jgi:hypothetical protein
LVQAAQAAVGLDKVEQILFLLEIQQ